MWPSGATYLPADYCFSELALLKNQTKLVGIVKGGCRRGFLPFDR